MMLNAHDLATVTRTVYGEASGETEDGQRAVAWVIRNRAAAALRFVERRRIGHPLFGGGTPASACLMPMQFSCWNATDPNTGRIAALTPDDLEYRRIAAIVSAVFDAPDDADPTAGATNYHTVKPPAVYEVWPPRWTAPMNRTVTIGNHVFYNPHFRPRG